MPPRAILLEMEFPMTPFTHSLRLQILHTRRQTPLLIPSHQGSHAKRPHLRTPYLLLLTSALCQHHFHLTSERNGLSTLILLDQRRYNRHLARATCTIRYPVYRPTRSNYLTSYLTRHFLTSNLLISHIKECTNHTHINLNFLPTPIHLLCPALSLTSSLLPTMTRSKG